MSISSDVDDHEDMTKIRTRTSREQLKTRKAWSSTHAELKKRQQIDETTSVGYSASHRAGRMRQQPTRAWHDAGRERSFSIAIANSQPDANANATPTPASGRRARSEN